MQLEGSVGFSVLEACDAARVSRAGFYRHFDEHLPLLCASDGTGTLRQLLLTVLVPS